MTNSNAFFNAINPSLGFKLQLDAVWQRNLPLIRERLERLDAFTEALAAGTTTEEDWEAAMDILHKFSGSLGMFGYSAGSQQARALEKLLTNEAPDARRVRDMVKSIRAILKL